VTGKKDTTATAAAKPKCDPSSAVITSDVVNRYLKSLSAADAAVQQLAKQPGSTGAYYSAVLKRKAIQKRKDEFDLHRGPDWDKQQAIQKRLMTGDTTAIKPMMALEDSLNPNLVKVPDLSWDDQQKANASVDSTMRAAGQFSACDWLDLGERLPRLVYILADDPNAKELQGFGTASEAAAIRPRLSDLAAGLGVNYVSPEEKARRKKQADAEARQAQVPPSSGDPQTDCIIKAQTEWAKAHQAELEAAQKAQDMNAIMKLNTELQAATAKCAQ
jgi:hypothetical protein